MSGEPGARSHEDDAVRLPGWGRVVLGVGLVWHLFAIVVAPASVAPASPLVRRAWDVTSPYTRALYLNHGYRFFAPDPPDYSTLLRFDVESPDFASGTERGDLPGLVYGDGRASLTIPSRDIQPRLLYHRHFMLCEQLFTARGASEEEFERWVESQCRHALHATGAKRGRVLVTVIRHYRPSPEMMLNGVTLDAPASYQEEPLGEFPFEGPDHE